VFAPSNLRAGRNVPILCYVTDRKSVSHAAPTDLSSALIRKIAAIASAGVDWIQLRERDLSARSLSNLTREAFRLMAAQPAPERGTTRILINDRVDVALAEHTGGVHLGEKGLPVSEVRVFVESRVPFRVAQALPLTPPTLPVRAQAPATSPAPDDFLLGVSCHSLEAAKFAATNGADYIFFGPIFATPSKAGMGNPQGTTLLAEVCRSIHIPVLALGGITRENAAACIIAGAAGIAAIRLFQDAPDSTAIVKELRQLTA
jgi:thiamine-phosphate pyrophosphorylase